MILGFGAILLGFIGAIGASVAAPLAAIAGGVAKLRGGRGFAVGMLTWVLATAVAITVMILGLGGDAGRGVDVHGVPIDDLIEAAPWALLAAVVVWIGFSIAASRRGAQ